MVRLARIIDANTNRAREALRVLEDVARFGLDQAGLAHRLKALRHELYQALDALGMDTSRRIAARDVAHDVGACSELPASLRRDGLGDVARAAAGRLAEALRSIEECAKAWAGPAGGLTGTDRAQVVRRLESLRFEAYELERALVLALGTGRGRQWTVCVLLSESLCAPRTWEEVARGAIAGGADCLQLREKSLSDAMLLERARRLVELSRPAGVSVVINDRIDVALLARADGAHLGQTDLPLDAARALAGGELILGVSCATEQQARAAVESGADYWAIGPMFASTTKPDRPPAGPELLRRCLSDAAVSCRPHLAIGGITPDNAAQIRAAGGRGIAVSSAVCRAADPAEVCRRLRDAMT